MICKCMIVCFDAAVLATLLSSSHQKRATEIMCLKSFPLNGAQILPKRNESQHHCTSRTASRGNATALMTGWNLALL